MIGENFNYDDVFFRDLTVCVLDTLEGQIKWTNNFTSNDVYVDVPFYYSMTGDERFLLDSFTDDIVSGDSCGNGRYIELNTDIIPRAHVTLKSFNIREDEFANPTTWLRTVVENEQEIRKILGRIRAIPVTVNYEIVITLASELDSFKCSQAIMNTIWPYKFMYFEYNFMNIDAVILMPESTNTEITRDKNLTSDNVIKMTFSIDVQTYYPAFRPDRVDIPGYTKDPRSEFYNHDDYGNVKDYSVNPKRTKWFNNILKGREENSRRYDRPNKKE